MIILPEPDDCQHLLNVYLNQMIGNVNKMFMSWLFEEMPGLHHPQVKCTHNPLYLSFLIELQYEVV